VALNGVLVQGHPFVSWTNIGLRKVDVLMVVSNGQIFFQDLRVASVIEDDTELEFDIDSSNL
jgi:hypothetical protein